jgi:GntR family transcriptional regulator/MocR family aminotransferase
VLEIAFHPDRAGDVPFARQLADHLAALIGSGRLAPGVKLPASREAAASLRLGRNTVSAAYDMLAARGLIAARVGQGTFVAPPSAAASLPGGAAAAVTPREFAWGGLFARHPPAGVLPPAITRSETHGVFPFDFRGGRIEARALPLADLRWAFAAPFRTRTRLQELAAHHDPRGWPPLRREIARHLASRGLACEPDDVMVVGGIQQAIDLAARVLVDPGDAVAIEQPGYFGAALAFAGQGAEVLGVEVDDEGLRTERLARILRLRRVKLLYVTPATQSPTGAVMSRARRDALLALADEHQVPIFEDDYDSDLRYAGPLLPALKAADPAGQIVYAGTFSKVLFPGLRVGYVVAARPLLERMVAARWVGDFGSPVVEQAALATLLGTRGLDRHLRAVRRLYAARLQALLAALRRNMPDGVRWTEPRGGHQVWVTLPHGIDVDRLQQAARTRGVAYTRGELFHLDGRGAEHVSLAFSALEPAVIAEGVARLGALVRQHLPTSRPAGRHSSSGVAGRTQKGRAHGTR